jgi:hypothetical protein
MVRSRPVCLDVTLTLPLVLARCHAGPVPK